MTDRRKCWYKKKKRELYRQTNWMEPTSFEFACDIYALQTPSCTFAIIPLQGREKKRDRKRGKGEWRRAGAEGKLHSMRIANESIAVVHSQESRTAQESFANNFQLTNTRVVGWTELDIRYVRGAVQLAISCSLSFFLSWFSRLKAREFQVRVGYSLGVYTL